ncbi:uncharacterized protein [Oryza sativa Japonica Group]|uniref:uncharacterized protein n=1 Tax=Oryza sativa subsp. japonica TaxID=39947 RepID=UPI00339C54D0
MQIQPRRRGRSLPRTRQPPVKALLEEVLLHAAFEGNLRIFRKNVRALDEGDGRLADKVGAVRDSDGLGALHLAAAREKLPVCHYLVEELRVDVDAVDNKGETALTFAINCGNEDMVRYLLDHGADTEKINNDGLTALHFAAGEGKCKIVEILLSKGAYIDSLTTGGTALHCAAYNGRDAVVKILLDHHADHKKVSWGAYTPLFVAVESGSLKCLKLLIEAGADVKGIGKEIPLITAASKGLTDIIKCLLEAGADPNVRDCLGHMPIEVAARCGERKAIEILFPVTSRIQSVSDWTVDGIINHVKSLPEVKEEDFCEATLDMGKFQGREAVKNKDYLGAMNIYTAAIALNPRDASLFSNRSLCWLHLGEGKKALMDAEACRMMRPDWPKACYRKGTALMLLKDYKKACNSFLLDKSLWSLVVILLFAFG